MKPYFVICGNHHEFARYSDRTSHEKKNLVEVVDREILLTETDPEGIFIGTWQTNPKIWEILVTLIVLTEGTVKNNKLMIVRQRLIQYDDIGRT
jgi:hypothetical protein